MRKTTTCITHGAMTASITVVLLLIDRVFAGFLMSFLPLPLIVYGLYYSIKEALITYVVTVLLVMIVPGQLPTTVLMVIYGFVGMIYIAVFKSQMHRFIKFLFVYGGMAIGYFVMIRFFGTFFGLEFHMTVDEVVRFLKVTNPQTAQNLAIVVILLTILLETFIIFMGANIITQRMKVHRK